jgi:hypothetical protein
LACSAIYLVVYQQNEWRRQFIRSKSIVMMVHAHSSSINTL